MDCPSRAARRAGAGPGRWAAADAARVPGGTGSAAAASAPGAHPPPRRRDPGLPPGVPALPAAPPAPTGESASSAAPRPGGREKRTLRGADKTRARGSGPPLPPPTCSRGLRTSADTTAIFLTVSSSRRRMTDNTARLRRRTGSRLPLARANGRARRRRAPPPPRGVVLRLFRRSTPIHVVTEGRRLRVGGPRAAGTVPGGVAPRAGTSSQPQGLARGWRDLLTQAISCGHGNPWGTSSACTPGARTFPLRRVRSAGRAVCGFVRASFDAANASVRCG